MILQEQAARMETFYRQGRETIKPRGYWNAMAAACAQSAMLMVRRQRLILAAVVALLPVAIPLAMSFFSTTQYATVGGDTLANLADNLHIKLLAPLLALFFATMLVGEEVEGQTMAYLLTRPTPKLAWITGRFLAYLLVSSAILVTSVLLTAFACTTQAEFPINAVNVQLAFHYAAVSVAALAAYGALMVFLGATTRRPIIHGVIWLYGWEKAAPTIPGAIDLFTIQKYVMALLPKLAAQRSIEQVQTEMVKWEREVFLVGAAKASVMIFIIVAALLIGSVITVRWREYYPARTIG